MIDELLMTIAPQIWLFVGNWLASVLIGILSSLVASWFFWRHLLGKKPDVQISPYIAKWYDDRGQVEFSYRFKVFNYSKRTALNVSIRCTVSTIQIVPGGQISKGVRRLPFSTNEIRALGPKKNLGDPWGLSPVQIFVSRPDFDVEHLLRQENAKLLVTLSATDVDSGSTLVRRIPFDAHQIISGTFEYGPSLKVIRTDIADE